VGFSDLFSQAFPQEHTYQRIFLTPFSLLEPGLGVSYENRDLEKSRTESFRARSRLDPGSTI